jgi:hypothetical protein
MIEPRPVDLEQLIGQLAGLEVAASTADRMLAEAVAELGCSAMLGPCQRLLDRLRDEYHAGPDREAEPIAAGWWRVGDTITRLTESEASMHQGRAPRLQASVAGCWQLGRLYVEPSFGDVPEALGQVAGDIARYQHQPLVLSSTPGRLHLDGMPWELVGLRGRCALDVHLADALGVHAGIGIVVEVADPRDVEALAHELVHAGGGYSEALAHRLGHDLARWATASGR